MKTVIYRSTKELECKCDAEVIICLDNALTASGAPYIEGTLNTTTTSVDSCLNTVFAYYLEYDEDDLADPTYSLVSSDINGVLCKGCLTDYIDWLFHSVLPS